MIFTSPEENTIAFGGVATGNINANEAEIVHGSIMYQGWTLRFTA